MDKYNVLPYSLWKNQMNHYTLKSIKLVYEIENHSHLKSRGRIKVLMNFKPSGLI